MSQERDDHGGTADRFPATKYSAIRQLSSTDAKERERALGLLVSAYWKPCYKYVRIKWRLTPDNAEDLVQSFFAAVIEKDFLAEYDRSKARFRTFVRLCIDRFVANENRRQTAQKRAGDLNPSHVDYSDAEAELQSAGLLVPPDIESWFDKEWIRQLFETAVEQLRQSCLAENRLVHFKIFETYDLTDHDPNAELTYESLARTHKINVTDVTNYLALMRRQFREIVLHRIRELTTSDEEYRDEVRAVLRVRI